ncbi:MAG: hypothetical protein AB7F75_01980 [Planctomycetota bacterium]
MQICKKRAILALLFTLLGVLPLRSEERGDSGPTPSFEELFHDGSVLMNSPHQSDETFTNRHRKEGFLREDLLDFITWLSENTISPNPALMSLPERRAFLTRYIEFMASPKYLQWLADRSVSESLFEEWLKVWRGLGINEQNLLHERTMEVKKMLMEKGSAPDIFVRRNAHLFQRPPKEPPNGLAPSEMSTTPLSMTPSLKEHRFNWFFKAGNFLQRNILVTLAVCAGFFILSGLAWKAARGSRRP